MHELSVALSLLDVISETLIRDADVHARATKVTVEVGALSGVVPDALRTAFTSAVAGGDLDGCAIELVPVAVALSCEPCGAEMPARAANDLRCAGCGTPSELIVRGRELDVTAITWEPGS
jgi:hydrogenase nickel incorporation protein HypA/HybF